MSGIFGYVQRNVGETGKGIAIQGMQSWNRAYGREGEEVFEGTGFCIGCALEKLSVEAVKSTPVLKRDKKYAVIDAVLYNREELMERCGITENYSDEELLLRYIEMRGIDTLKDVNGDFSGAVYNEEENSLVLFRDHMGVRPLYYYAIDELVVFSTDLRGLISVREVDAGVNEEWLYKTIAGYTTGSVDKTEFQHVLCVPPGEIVKFTLGENKFHIEKKAYWKVGAKKIRCSSEQEYIGRLRELITDSVKRRLDAISGVVGAELSGGLDSGVISILINRMGREGVYFSWSVNPKDVPYAENDERLRIADICKQESITCNYSERNFVLDEKSNLAQNVEEILPDIDMEEHTAFRYVWPPFINAMTICGTAEYISRNGARTVFTGHGGDEGVSHRCNPYELFFHREYLHFLRQEWALAYGQKPRVWKFAKQCGKVLLRTRKKLKASFRMSDAAPELLNAEFAGRFEDKKMPAMTFAYDAKNYIREGGSRNRLDNVALTGAYGGVRYIVPFLDYRVVDFAVSIPRYMYLKGKQNRYIFREAFKDILPESLYTVRIKESTSKNNIQRKTSWEESFFKARAEIVGKLDRPYWEKYLDFSVIDNWSQKENVAEEERISDTGILRCLLACGMVQNLVEKTRGEGMK